MKIGKKQQQTEKEHFFDKQKNIKGLFLFFCITLLILLLSEFLIHKHTFFQWEEWPWFYAVFGFVAFIALIFTAKYILRPIIKRKEDYYD